jgi:hypothetical protein
VPAPGAGTVVLVLVPGSAAFTTEPTLLQLEIGSVTSVLLLTWYF